MRRHSSGMSNLRAGLLALAVILIGCFLGFTKDIPFTKPFEIDAVFESATSIRPGSAVRIAGVNVGKVKSVTAQEGTNAAVVTMQIDDHGLPIHTDATAKIRPRIFLEGNFFIDLKPGTPAAPVLDAGDTIKVTQTARPVQLDEVLTALQSDTRGDLQSVLDEIGVALGDEPTAAQDERADRSVRGQTGAEAFNDAYDDIAPAEQSTAIVNEALLGVEPDEDIQRLLRGLADTTEGLSRNEVQLQDLVTNLNRTMAAFADEQTALRATIRDLGPTLETANSALASLNASFPPVREFAHAVLPGVRETPATIEAGFPWIDQTRKLLRQSELGGLAKDLQPASRDLARLVDASLGLFPQADLLAKCAKDVVLPTGDIPIRDEFETGQPNYREFMYALVGLSGESQNFDGNGQYVRFQPGGGNNMLSMGEAGTPGGQVFGNGFEGLGNRPQRPPRQPPYNADTPCYRSAIPDLNGPWAAKGEVAQPQVRTAAKSTASPGAGK
jgi:phospholipid/cholesterol/gamma-HCH transport system substrate-binding protein